MSNFYCEYCGKKFTSIPQLTSSFCPKHPDGFSKGKHKLYEGSEKSQYFCKYCGKKFSSIQPLTASSCPRHPDGFCKGKHAPAL